MLSPESYLPKTDFERLQFSKGEAKGKAESILHLLALRGIAVSEEVRARVMAERDQATLIRWLERSLTAQSSAELFA